MTELTELDLTRFWSKVDKCAGSGCWQWRGHLSFGYGRFQHKGKHYRAHRFSYELHVGAIPNGLVIDHLCRNRACVNPAHLEAVTSRENTLRGNGPTAQQAKQTHCKRGHEFSQENTWTTKSGMRHCRACSRQNVIRTNRKVAQCPTCGKTSLARNLSRHMRLIHG